jgi:protein SCO1/2
MMRLIVLAVVALALAGPAQAGFSQADLAAVSASPGQDAALPLDLAFTDEAGQPRTIGAALGGKPAVLIFADYTCHTLCGPILDFAAAALDRSGLQPGSDYRLLVIGLDPKDGRDAAHRMRRDHLGDGALAQNAIFLTGTDAAIRTATAALGYRYAYDAEHDQFAHPAAAYVLDVQGRVTRVLSGLGLSGTDMRLALVAAGNGHTGTLGDRIRLLCYGYDPVRGIYTERITTFLQIGALATVIALAGGIILMARAHPRVAP